MSVLRPTPVRFEPVSAAPLLSDLGFVASPDLPDRPGPAYLLVALRASPTLRHYDPEAVEYWVSDGGKGSRRTVTRSTRVPLESEFSWGLIRIVDRLHVTNEYLTFGGHLSVDSVDDVTVAVFASPAPMLRRGGHSQDWDEGAETLAPSSAASCSPSTWLPGSRAGWRPPIPSRATPRSSRMPWPAIEPARCSGSSNLASGRCSRRRSAGFGRTTRPNGRRARRSGTRPHDDHRADRAGCPVRSLTRSCRVSLADRCGAAPSRDRWAPVSRIVGARPRCVRSRRRIPRSSSRSPA